MSKLTEEDMNPPTSRIKIYNPRTLMRQGGAQMLTDAADPANQVFFRVGRVMTRNRRRQIKSDESMQTQYQDDNGVKVFRLVEVTPDELAGIQKQLDEEAQAVYDAAKLSDPV